MPLKSGFIFGVVLIQIVIAHEENNLINDALKSNFSYPSPERWTLAIAPNVYLTHDYNLNYIPNGFTCDTATIGFENIQIVNVDQRKKEVALELLAYIIWKDDRINVLDTSNDYKINLPPITSENNKPIIWTPHNKFSGFFLRDRTYLQDSTIMNVGLLGRNAANKLFEADNFLSNGSDVFVYGSVELRLKIWCPFNFLHFPFDHNVCPVAVRFENMNVKFADQKFMYFPQILENVVDGFIINKTNLGPVKWEHPKLEMYWTVIGFKISLKRQVGKYIYQYYLPCFVIVITSSFSFIIPLSAVPGRVSLIVTLFLTLTNIFIVQMVRNLP